MSHEYHPIEGNDADIVALLFNAAMAGDRAAFCVKHRVSEQLLDSLRRQYADKYIAFLEGMLKRIRSRVDD